MAMAVGASAQYDFSSVAPSGQTLYYKIVDGNAQVVSPTGWYDWEGYTMPTGALTIPNNVIHNGNTYAVTSIGEGAFCDCSGLISVIIPETITGIRMGAFSYCSGLTSVIIPETVTIIENDAFYMCSSLTSVSLPNSISTIGDDVFYGTAIPYPVYTNSFFVYLPTTYTGNYTIPNGITSICGGACASCSGLSSINLPNSLGSIGSYAFANCSGLTSISIPDAVSSIGCFAFAYCTELTTVSITNPIDSIIECSNPFFGCTNLTSFTQPIFHNNCLVYFPPQYSGSYIIPEGTTAIWPGAFGYCFNLTAVTIPNTVTAIYFRSFIGCGGLSNLTIPESVDTIGFGAFDECYNLQSITFNNPTPPSFCEIWYDNYPALTAINVPCNGIINYTGFWRPWCHYHFVGYNNQDATIYLDTTIYACYNQDFWYYFLDTTITDTGDYTMTTIGGCENITVNLHVVVDTSSISFTDTLDVFQSWIDYHFGEEIDPGIVIIGSEYSLGETVHGCDSLVQVPLLVHEDPKICMVSVESGHNEVIWNNEVSNVRHYDIYREGDVANQYDLVASVPSDISSWRDEDSRPGTRSYRYRMSAVVDSILEFDPFETPQSTIHKTAHLTMSHGVGNNWNLVWTEYEGTEFVTYVIYRGENQYELEEIDRLPVGGNTTYTDDQAPEGDVYYQVGIVPATPCAPDQAKSGDVIRTNIATNGVLGIEGVYSDNIRVFASDGRIVVRGGEGLEVKVYDMMGRIVAEKSDSCTTLEVPTTGVYMVKIGNHSARKVVVVR